MKGQLCGFDEIPPEQHAASGQCDGRAPGDEGATGALVVDLLAPLRVAMRSTSGAC